MAKEPTEDRSTVSLIGGLSPKLYKPSIELFVRLIEENYGENVRSNEMSGRFERYDADRKAWVQWLDADDARMAAYFQSTYGLYSPKMLDAATILYFDRHRVNPLTELIDNLKWDGQHRIERFLIDTVKCEDNDYNHEVSRLIFAGGIHRAYRPGCKFDDMPVLIGKQGGGKSTLVRWLNMEDDFFREVKTITGKEAVEAIRGCWIGEVAELMAMTKIKEQEAVKAFITSQEDTYRTPYSRRPESLPRRCIFIGTTNNGQFLSDKTGNRRYYPVICEESGYDLLAREGEIRAYIAQCWAEALYLFKRGDLKPYAKRELLEKIQREQNFAEEDDWRVGAIREYVQDVKKRPDDVVCVIELWHRALNQPEEVKPTRSDSIEINKIMSNMEGWERVKSPVKVGPWGFQRVFRKVRTSFYPF